MRESQWRIHHRNREIFTLSFRLPIVEDDPRWKLAGTVTGNALEESQFKKLFDEEINCMERKKLESESLYDLYSP